MELTSWLQLASALLGGRADEGGSACPLPRMSFKALINLVLRPVESRSYFQRLRDETGFDIPIDRTSASVPEFFAEL